MPRIVSLPTRKPPPTRKRRGRDLAAVLLAAAAITAEADDTQRRTLAGQREQPHMSYNPNIKYRLEIARHLNSRARRIVGVSEFIGY